MSFNDNNNFGDVSNIDKYDSESNNTTVFKNNLSRVSNKNDNDITIRDTLNSNITAPQNIQFITEKEFKKATYCLYCDRIFDFNLRRHHCRICGSSCCDNCSKKKIKKNRICDMCYYKTLNYKFEIQKENYIASMIEMNKELEEKISELKDLIEQKKIEKEEIDKQLYIENKNQKEENDALEKEIEEIELEFDNKKKELYNLEEKYNNKQKKLEYYKKKLEDNNNEISIMYCY